MLLEEAPDGAALPAFRWCPVALDRGWPSPAFVEERRCGLGTRPANLLLDRMWDLAVSEEAQARRTLAACSAQIAPARATASRRLGKLSLSYNLAPPALRT